MQKKTRVFFILIVFITFCGLNSCHQASHQIPSHKRLLRTCLATDPPSFDPRLTGDIITQEMVQCLFSGLTYIDSEGKVALALADSFKFSEDGQRVIATLKKSQWSDGTALTAFDFEATWKTALDPEQAAHLVDLMYVIKGARQAKQGELPLDQVSVKALDGQTLEIVLEHRTPYFLELLANPFFYAIPKSMRDKCSSAQTDHSESLICSGPFKLRSYSRQQELVLERNPYYWDSDHVQLEGIHFAIMQNADTALMLFEKGALDWLGAPLAEIPMDAIPKLKKQNKLTVYPVASVRYLDFNTTKIPFANTNIRRAFALAVDRQAIIENILQSNDPPALGLISPLQKKETWHPFFSDCDILKAQQLFRQGLDELGITISDFPEIILSYNTSDSWKKVIQVLQNQWSQLFHIPIRIQNYDWNTYLHLLRTGDFQIARDGWSSQINDPANLLDLFKYDNFGKWFNPQYVALLDAADQENKPEKRKVLLEAAEKLLMDQMPIIPLFHPGILSIQQPELKGVNVTLASLVDFRNCFFDP
jgi:oligopeptide transport system substrate-binding protein